MFYATSIGTMLAASLGCTPIIVYVEAAAGIAEGGKTGLTAIVTGVLFLISVFFAPLFASIPAIATAPVLMLIGAMMMSTAKQIDWDDMMEAVPAFLTIIMMPYTFSITNGIMFGLFSSFVFYVFTGTIFTDLKVLYNHTINFQTLLQDEQPLIRKNSLSFSNPDQDISTKLVRRPSLISPREEARRVLINNSD